MQAVSFSIWPRLALMLVLTVCVTACGGGNAAQDSDGGTQQPADPADAGRLVAATPLGSLSAADIRQALDPKEPLLQGIAPLYNVTSYRLEYLTTDRLGQTVRASGLVSVPVKAAGSRSPVLSFQHGTLFRDAEAPSNHAVATEVAVLLASLGYLALAPDYVGYGVSKGTAHPYLLSAPSAAATIDFLSAAKSWRQASGVADNGQLFLAGYSEGGYVTLAAHRALQASNSVHLPQLRLVVPGAGPYDVEATLDALIDLIRDEKPLLGALLSPSLLRYLGASVRREVRSELLKHLLPEDADVVLDTQFIDNFLADDTEAIERLSSVHDWKPNLPVRLFHGRQDQTVPYASAEHTLQAMQARGAGDLVSLTPCQALPSSHTACALPYLNHLLGLLTPLAQDL